MTETKQICFIIFRIKTALSWIVRKFSLDVTDLLRECFSVSRDEYGRSNLAAADDFEEEIKDLPPKIQEVLRGRKIAFRPLMAHDSC